MRDRIIGALETGCRLGEMLKIQKRHGFGTRTKSAFPPSMRRTPSHVESPSSQKAGSRSS
jgi:hypothetical protein